MCAPVGVPALTGAFCCSVVLANRATTEKVDHIARLVKLASPVDMVDLSNTMDDMGKLDPDDSRPPYVQVADLYRKAIENGDLRPGDKLPAHHHVVSEFGVSLGVVKRAYSVLQQDGLIVTRQGQGAFVRTRPAEPGSSRDDELTDIRATLTEVITRLTAIEQRLAETGR